jgi:inner membrane transporter RhtA
MARLPRASFALMLSLLPAVATVMGALILAQIPSLRDSLGVALVMLGIAIHRPAPAG